MAPFAVVAIVAAGLFGTGTTAKIAAPKDKAVQQIGTVMQVAGVGTLVGGALGSAIGAAGGVQAVGLASVIKAGALATPITLGAVAGGVAGAGTGVWLVRGPMGH